jgi:hypothetical protein
MSKWLWVICRFLQNCRIGIWAYVVVRVVCAIIMLVIGVSRHSHHLCSIKWAESFPIRAWLIDRMVSYLRGQAGMC